MDLPSFTDFLQSNYSVAIFATLAIMIIIIFIATYNTEKFIDKSQDWLDRTGGSGGSFVVDYIDFGQPGQGDQTRRWSYYKKFSGDSRPLTPQMPPRNVETLTGSCGGVNRMVNLDDYLNIRTPSGEVIGDAGDESTMERRNVKDVIAQVVQQYYDCIAKGGNAETCSMNMQDYVDLNFQAKLYNP